MFRRLASRVRLLRLVLSFIWRNLECQYLARVANRHEEWLMLLLECIAREYQEASEARFEYNVHTQPLPGYTLEPNGKRTSEICWEAPVCCTVSIDHKPLVGMAVEFRGNALCIRQLQGQPGASIPKELRNWPALFVHAGKNFLNNSSTFKTLRLYAADQRPSYKIPATKLSDEEMRRHQQTLRRRYDGTARQQGFKKTRKGYFLWDLSIHKPNKK